MVMSGTQSPNNRGYKSRVFYATKSSVHPDEAIRVQPGHDYDRSSHKSNSPLKSNSAIKSNSRQYRPESNTDRKSNSTPLAKSGPESNTDRKSSCNPTEKSGPDNNDDRKSTFSSNPTGQSGPDNNAERKSIFTPSTKSEPDSNMDRKSSSSPSAKAKVLDQKAAIHPMEPQKNVNSVMPLFEGLKIGSTPSVKSVPTAPRTPTATKTEVEVLSQSQPMKSEPITTVKEKVIEAPAITEKVIETPAVTEKVIEPPAVTEKVAQPITSTSPPVQTEPLENFIGKFVQIHGERETTFKGLVFSVDPISKMVMLGSRTKPGGPMNVQLVSGWAVKSISLAPDDPISRFLGQQEMVDTFDRLRKDKLEVEHSMKTVSASEHFQHSQNQNRGRGRGRGHGHNNRRRRGWGGQSFRNRY